MEVRKLGPDDLIWDFDNENPYYRCGAGKYRRSFRVDPQPGYAHDVERVKDLVASCDEAFPLADRAELCVLDHEFTGRTNGLAFEDAIYEHSDGSDWRERVECGCGKEGCTEMLQFCGQGHGVVLCGKRIPPMPAMTRYLVTHEYGHCAFNRAARLRRVSTSQHDLLEKEYLRVRGCEDAWRPREGTRWHLLPSEIIANDFRCIVMGAVTEFWPHAVPQMTPDSPIGEWWTRARETALEASRE